MSASPSSGSGGGKHLVRCPQCGGEAVWSEANPFRPFCSQRCKQIDLGAWASDRYRVPAASPQDGEPEAQRGFLSD